MCVCVLGGGAHGLGDLQNCEAYKMGGAKDTRYQC